ncbi:MAG: type II toxin-antitoxin system VapC family toxin [Spirochaeta sp.]|nr:type II toxin-antitoxin system VapC family toxin [Spirochaeta sp.]
MKTALDSSVLLALFNKEAGWEKWNDLIRESLSLGPLLVCPVVFAEVSMGFPSDAVCLKALQSIGIEYSEFTPRSAWIAGRVFLRYRREGGLRDHLIPDFLIAAHATTQAHRLAAVDRGYLRRYFGELELITPQ